MGFVFLLFLSKSVLTLKQSRLLVLQSCFNYAFLAPKAKTQGRV